MILYWRRAWQPSLKYSCLKNPPEQRSLIGCNDMLGEVASRFRAVLSESQE